MWNRMITQCEHMNCMLWRKGFQSKANLVCVILRLQCRVVIMSTTVQVEILVNKKIWRIGQNSNFVMKILANEQSCGWTWTHQLVKLITHTHVRCNRQNAEKEKMSFCFTELVKLITHTHVRCNHQNAEKKQISFCFTVDTYVATMNTRVSGRLPWVKKAILCLICGKSFGRVCCSH